MTKNFNKTKIKPYSLIVKFIKHTGKVKFIFAQNKQTNFKLWQSCRFTNKKSSPTRV